LLRIISYENEALYQPKKLLSTGIMLMGLRGKLEATICLIGVLVHKELQVVYGT
jgi:hypothetical protein